MILRQTLPIFTVFSIALIAACFALNSAAIEHRAYSQLAYKPMEETRVIDMPGSLFAVQLLAVSTKQQVEAFAETHNLYDLTAVLIERNGQQLYVLLPGVYQNKKDAQAAIESLPKAVRAMKPWIRPLEGLQQAMRRVPRPVYAATED